MAAELLARNVGPGLRNTTGARPGAAGATRLWVYRRSGLPCLRCGTEIRRMGRQARSTYWCPTCQR